MKIQIQPVEGKSPRLPDYKSAGAAGADIHACLDNQISVEPKQTVLIPAGFKIAVPPGYEAQIRPRSGLALKHNITLLNSPGTIDSDYRGEVKIILTNLGDKLFAVNDGDRIAQMVIAPVVKVQFEFSNELPNTERGEGGFGHTGRK